MLEDAVVEIARVLSGAVPGSSNGAPTWIEIVPKPEGGQFVARDGRRFVLEGGAEQFVARLNASGEQFRVDLDHESESFWGGSTASYGWATQFKVEAGSVWAKMDWAPDTVKNYLSNRRYRSVSPAFYVDRESAKAFYQDPKNAPPMKVTGLSSIALTNSPALRVLSLNSTEAQKMRNELCKLLGLSPDCSDSDLEATLIKFNATREESDSDIATLRAKNAKLESELASIKEATIKAAETSVNTAIAACADEAVAAGKLTPTERDYHVKQCLRGSYSDKTQALAEFKELIKSRPVSHLFRESGPPAPKVHSAHAHPSVRAVASIMEVSTEELDSTLKTMADNPQMFAFLAELGA